MTELPPTDGRPDPAAADDKSRRRIPRRDEREAEALRENLHRRKQQARARDTLKTGQPKPD